MQPGNLQNQNTAESLRQLSTKPKRKKPVSPFIVLFGILITLLCGLLIFILVTNFLNTGNTPQPQTTKTTIKFWSNDLNEETLNQIISDFESQNPNIDVVYERQTSTNYDERIKTRLTGNSTNIANVFEVSDYLVPDIYTKLVPLTDSTIRSRYSITLLNNSSVSNVSYGTPFRFDSLVLAYNKDHLAEIQFTEEDFNKQDWSSLVSTTRQLTNKTVTTNPQTKKQVVTINRAGIAIGSPKTVTNATNTFKLLLSQNGTEVYNPQTKKFSLASNSKFNEVANFYARFVLEDIWDDSLGNDIQAFTSGKVSIILVTAKDIDKIKQLNPGLNMGTALPAKIGNLKYLSLSKSLVIPNYMPNRAETLKFVEFVTRPANSIKLYDNKDQNTFIPAQTETLGMIPKSSNYAVFSTIHTLSSNYSLPENEQVTEAMNDYLLEVYERYYQVSTTSNTTTFKIDGQRLETILNQVLTN